MADPLQPQRRAAVALFSHRGSFGPLEEVSLRQLGTVLGHHDIFFVHPAGVDTGPVREFVPGIRPMPVPPSWLASLRAYNRTKCRPWIYRRFQAYEFLLTYEPDCFVFRDELSDWCDKGWDYIGAPWFEGVYRAAWDAASTGVGNSGFSLRRLPSVRRVLRSFRMVKPLGELLEKRKWVRHSGASRWVSIGLNAVSRNRFHWSMNSYRGNEDFFWGLEAASRFSWWRTADYDSARRFSFEANAPRLFQEIGGLPFGCHKWTELHPSFWRPHIEAFGHRLPDDYGQTAG